MARSRRLLVLICCLGWTGCSAGGRRPVRPPLDARGPDANDGRAVETVETSRVEVLEMAEVRAPAGSAAGGPAAPAVGAVAAETVETAPRSAAEVVVADERGRFSDDDADSRARPRPPARASEAVERRRAKAPKARFEPPKTVAPVAPALGGVVTFADALGRQALRPDARAARAVIWVDGARARTVVDLVFEVSEKSPPQATFTYTLPADAVPAGFSVFDAPRDLETLFQRGGPLPDLPSGFVPPERWDAVAPAGAGGAWGRRRDAGVDVRAKAVEAAEDDVRRRAPSATAAWAGGRQLTIELSPVTAARPLRIVLAYEETLPVGDDGRMTHAIRLPDGADQRSVTLFTTHPRAVDAPAGRWSAAGRWRRHDVRSAPPSPRWTFATPVGPLAIRGADAGGLSGDFFYVRCRLPETAAPSVRPTGAAVMVLDVSRRAADDGGAARQIELLERILAADRSIRRYVVLLYDVRARWLHGEGWRPNDAERRRQTLDALRRVDRDGAADPSTAVRAVAAAPWIERGTTAFLMTLGPRTWGPATARIARRARGAKARWWVYAMSGPARDDELAELAGDDGHPVVAVASRDAVAAAATAHRSGPTRSLRVDGPAGVTVVGVPASALPGQTLHFAGRISREDAVNLRIVFGGRTVARVPLAGNSPLAARAWAQVALTSWRRDGWSHESWVPVAEWFRLAPEGLAYVASPSRAARQTAERVEAAVKELVRGAAPSTGTLALTPELREVVWAFERAQDRPNPKAREGAPSPRLWAQAEAERRYRHDRRTRPKDVAVYRDIVRARLEKDDVAGAVRALSSLVAIDPKNAATLRLVGYALLAMGEADPAAEVLQRVRRQRPFEGQAWLEAGLAYEAAGRLAMAARYYGHVWVGRWAEQSRSCRTVAAIYLRRLLRRGLARDVEPRHLESLLQRIETWLGEDAPVGPLTFFAHWSRPADLNLVVFGSDGRRCDPIRCTSTAGRILEDVRAGPGPEVFLAHAGAAGPVDALVEYAAPVQAKGELPVALLLVTDRLDGLRHHTVRLLPTTGNLVVIRSDRM